MSAADLVWIGAILAALLGLLRGTSHPAVVARVAPEVRRKVVHFAMAWAAALLPLVLGGVLPIALLSALAVSLFVLVRRIPWLRHRLGSILDTPQRTTVGDLAFAAAIPGVYLASGGEPVVHAVAMLILGTADAAAALIGQRLGRHRFAGVGAGKTPVGSLAFLAMALVLLMHAGPLAGEGLRIGVLLSAALACTAVELCLPLGLDNLGIPLAAAWILGGAVPAPLVAAAAGLVLGAALLRIEPRAALRAGPA